jgi:hypothetical protein
MTPLILSYNDALDNFLAHSSEYSCNSFYFFHSIVVLVHSIDGQTSLSARQEGIKEYNNVESETFIFLMSTRAGGLGIDLV